jgi:hypothetical protein
MIENKPDGQEQKYGNYLVAFIDILGFSGIIEKSTDEPEYFEQILEALKLIEHVVAHNEGKKEREDSSFKMTQFSDSLVISCPNTRLALFPMIMNLNFIQKVLANVGVMVRGGLTSGLLYHEGNIVFGPAFIKAYELESKKAVYPRIIIDPALLDGSANPAPIGDPIDEAYLYVNKKGTLKQDADGYYYVDFLGGYFSEPKVAEKLEKTISYQLSQLVGDDEKTIRIRAKLEWMLDYINKSK